MKTLVIGFGSIGSRHARLLKSLGCDVSIVSSRTVNGYQCYKTIASALDNCLPDYIVIANQTSLHHSSLNELIQFGYNGTVLVEKPLFHQKLRIPDNDFKNLFVGYNLRCHPAVKACRNWVMNESVITVNVYVGQYLPTWRAKRDYAECYSADKRQGGGVVRDLSHELDYLLWMFGQWKSVSAVNGHFSRLKGDSDDVLAAIFSFDRCPLATVQLNYLDRVVKREITINTEDHTARLDIVNSSLCIDGSASQFSLDSDTSYILQHQAVLEENSDNLCSGEQAEQVLSLIDACEKSSASRNWVNNE